MSESDIHGSGSATDGTGMPSGSMDAGSDPGSSDGYGDPMPGGVQGTSGDVMVPRDMNTGAPVGPSDGTGTDTPDHRTCGTMDAHRRLMIADERYARKRAEIEDQTLVYCHAPEFVAEFRTGLTRIPVVVHVVHNTPEQNVSDAQIQSQIDALNRDYRGTNPDVSQVPAVWQPFVADARIEFDLAGVTRTQTTVTSFSYGNDGVKSSATGGADPWPTDRFLNMWVCRLSGGLLGYAQFPGGPPETDGVVVTYTAFGTNGTATAPFNLGRTATHEVGHWLNLFHIWGDDGTGCSGSDSVDDTPNQGGPNYGVPTFPKVSCSNGPNGDMFVNYMDYTDDRGMVMFTKGQVGRVDACLEGPRSSFLTAGVRSSGPVVSWAAGRIDAFVRGTDHAIYHKAWDGSAWRPSPTGYAPLGGVSTSGAEAVSWETNRLDLFVRGTNHAVFHKAWDGSAWRPGVTTWESLGGAAASPPRAVAWGPDRLDVFVLGMDRALYHKAWDGSAWRPSVGGWTGLGGTAQGVPEVVAWGPNRLDVFVVGTDSALYHKWWDGSAWRPSPTGWENLGGVCASRPKAVAWGPNRLDLFVLGTSSALFHKAWTGSAWSPSVTGWRNLGGVCVGDPEVVAWGADRLDAFVLGTDSALYHKWWDGSSWGPSATGYERLGGVCAAPPKAVAWGPNRLDVFVEGTDSALYHKAWDGSAWRPSLTGFQNLGGVISALRAPALAEIEQVAQTTVSTAV